MTPDGQFPNVTKTPNPEVPESMDRAAALAASDQGRPGAGHRPRRRPPRRHGPRSRRQLALRHRQRDRRPADALQADQAGRAGPAAAVADRRHDGGDDRPDHAHRPAFQAQVVDNLLVGFKYIAEVLWQLEQHGGYEDVRGTPADFVIACEESHGILVTPQIRDKDAGGAAPAAGGTGPGPEAPRPDGAGLPRTACTASSATSATKACRCS